jgi:hypothetical protein
MVPALSSRAKGNAQASDPSEATAWFYESHRGITNSSPLRPYQQNATDGDSKIAQGQKLAFLCALAGSRDFSSSVIEMWVS